MKYSPDIVKELCKYIKAGNNQRDAAILAGISEETFYKWKRELDSDGKLNPEFHSEFPEALKKAELECKARNIAFVNQAAEKTWQAAAWWLERKYNNEFALKQINEIGGILDDHGKRRPIELFVNAGGGFIPPSLTIPTPPVTGTPTVQAEVQGVDLASEGTQDVHSDNGDSQAGTS